ncbi:7206_t:CDS:2 [Funneliformis geosporum]|uniref:10987_t:CDS:1 n=1 Tax=Funneliformis geosporum TaxID=1117311 RepID=A0A9W4WW08_9GLOM|nr:10987_t:CDS:2 [Funneliformis geosporum]CAI2192961.1 7206_t:CDS:2 [Funneliformis geosporum]
MLLLVSNAIIYNFEVIKRYRHGDATESASDFMFQVGNARLSALQPGTLQGAPTWSNQLHQNFNQLHQRFN